MSSLTKLPEERLQFKEIISRLKNCILHLTKSPHIFPDLNEPRKMLPPNPKFSSLRDSREHPVQANISPPPKTPDAPRPFSYPQPHYPVQDLPPHSHPLAHQHFQVANQGFQSPQVIRYRGNTGGSQPQPIPPHPGYTGNPQQEQSPPPAYAVMDQPPPYSYNPSCNKQSTASPVQQPSNKNQALQPANYQPVQQMNTNMPQSPRSNANQSGYPPHPINSQPHNFPQPNYPPSNYSHSTPHPNYTGTSPPAASYLPQPMSHPLNGQPQQMHYQPPIQYIPQQLYTQGNSGQVYNGSYIPTTPNNPGYYGNGMYAPVNYN